MFRIESYITPIILSHIGKYVKDFRPRDAQVFLHVVLNEKKNQNKNSQVSLWGGEVVFQNLDVRLDVLEEELQLPFNFVSGHIHELTVKVPWTKIASEPIQITINTIGEDCKHNFRFPTVAINHFQFYRRICSKTKKRVECTCIEAKKVDEK